ncbi:hypothetical protein K435DRAFT_857950 [Dendrothele bispora CBS 962.96]|uniref:Uncharacterized protein n=1 Tax=Dendrothele bispora (strain CBS 962.96) TaxID=1314807 RepID=A0A4S8M5N0_DENBC|nr:hypothetical protein K435DRAFT_857950 [Dendrothele bispora CBS 962.96]
MSDNSPSKHALFLKELSEDAQDLSHLLTKKKSPKIIEAQAKVILDKLVSMTPTDITASSNSASAFSAIDEAITTVNAATAVSGVGHLNHLKKARDIVQSIRRDHLKSRKKTTKLKQVIEVDEDASGEEDVEVVEKEAATKDNKTVTRSAAMKFKKTSTPEPTAVVEQDVQMADDTKGKNTPARAATVSIPYSDLPGMDTSSKSYLDAEYYLAQASKATKSTQQARTQNSSKRARASEITNTHTPDSHNAKRTSGTHAHKVLDDVAMLAFSDMNSKSTDSLKAIANYLALTSEQSLFQIQRARQDYLSHQGQRAAVLAILLQRSQIAEDAVEVALGAEEHQELEGGPSGSEPHLLIEVSS